MTAAKLQYGAVIDVRLILHDETDEAIRVSEAGHLRSSFWLPKALISFEKSVGNIVKVAMPEWLSPAAEPQVSALARCSDYFSGALLFGLALIIIASILGVFP